MTEAHEKQLKEAIDRNMKKVRDSALLEGATAIAGVVKNFIDEGKKKRENPALTLGKINHFCKISLNLNKEEPDK